MVIGFGRIRSRKVRSSKTTKAHQASANTNPHTTNFSEHEGYQLPFRIPHALRIQMTPEGTTTTTTTTLTI